MLLGFRKTCGKEEGGALPSPGARGVWSAVMRQAWAQEGSPQAPALLLALNWLWGHGWDFRDVPDPGAGLPG